MFNAGRVQEQQQVRALVTVKYHGSEVLARDSYPGISAGKYTYNNCLPLLDPHICKIAFI